jgi:hypothetical protein
MGITEGEMYELTFIEFLERCEIFNRQRIRELSKHRNILAAITGKPPKFIIELPGDWDDIPVSTPERVEKLMHRFKVHKKWTKEGVKVGKN